MNLNEADKSHHKAQVRRKRSKSSQRGSAGMKKKLEVSAMEERCHITPLLLKWRRKDTVLVDHTHDSLTRLARIRAEEQREL